MRSLRIALDLEDCKPVKAAARRGNVLNATYRSWQRQRYQFVPCLFALAVDDIQHSLALGCRAQVLVASLCDQNVILDAYASNAIELLQYCLVEEPRELGSTKEVSLEIVAIEVATKV
jgi:hypothetical protein